MIDFLILLVIVLFYAGFFASIFWLWEGEYLRKR